MPNYARYSDGRFSADYRTTEVQVLFGFPAGPKMGVRAGDPLREEQEQHEKQMVGHWIRPEVPEGHTSREKRDTWQTRS